MDRNHFTLRGFKPLRHTLESQLGPLEREVMDCLWSRSRPASVREVFERFLKTKEIAYTTVMTTLDRLFKKGLLQRIKEGRTFLYSPRFSRQEFRGLLARDMVDALLERVAEPVLSHFVEAVGRKDQKLLDRLEELVQEKRKSLR
ncbi:MAG: BlaI/MecI/CopY family transcriptional regulator [Acidobacteriia bacterium]|nr:BlaI/MecI/CopY family transcriptional regulator [Terriglobia bacterium]